MNRAASFGVGVCLATMIGVNAYEFTGSILERTSDMDERKVLAVDCLGKLSTQSVIVDDIPEECSTYVHRFSEAQDLEEGVAQPEKYQFRLPSKSQFIKYELQSIEDRENIDEKMQQAAGLIAAIGTFALSYQMTRSKPAV